MIESKRLVNFFSKNKINNYVGVPDSVLKNFLTYLEKEKCNNIIACNEGSAVGIAIGQYLSSKKISLVYLQNSGLANAINPLISMAHQKVYSIPMILMIGWRGHDAKDEPQHNLKGLITKKLLKILNIDYCELTKIEDFKSIKKLIIKSKKKSTPVAILIKKKDVFKKETIKRINKNKILRNYVINQLLDKIDKNTKIISTTGYTSRELFQIRSSKNTNIGQDFYMVGGMGHATSVSIGVALNSKKQVICLDGDGSLIMHLGSLLTAGSSERKNFKHILLNNGSHESVGGQKIKTEKLNFKNIIKTFGYKKFFIVKNKAELGRYLPLLLKSRGPSFMQIQIKDGSLINLKRPKNFVEIKKKFVSNK